MRWSLLSALAWSTEKDTSHRVSMSCWYLTSDRHKDGEMSCELLGVLVCQFLHEWKLLHVCFCLFLYEQDVSYCAFYCVLSVLAWTKVVNYWLFTSAHFCMNERHWKVTSHCCCINERGEFSSVILFLWEKLDVPRFFVLVVAIVFCSQTCRYAYE